MREFGKLKAEVSIGLLGPSRVAINNNICFDARIPESDERQETEMKISGPRRI